MTRAHNRPPCQGCDGSGYACAEIDDDGRAVDCLRCMGAGVDPFLDLLRSLVTSPEQFRKQSEDRL
jgi:hypothetical protein